MVLCRRRNRKAKGRRRDVATDVGEAVIAAEVGETVVSVLLWPLRMLGRGLKALLGALLD